jgi:hypothetical protein
MDYRGEHSGGWGIETLAVLASWPSTGMSFRTRPPGNVREGHREMCPIVAIELFVDGGRDEIEAQKDLRVFWSDSSGRAD